MYYHIYSSQSYIFVQNFSANHRNSKKTTTFAFNKRSVTYLRKCPITQHIVSDSGQYLYLQPIITQYFIDNKSEIWLLFLIAHSKR